MTPMKHKLLWIAAALMIATAAGALYRIGNRERQFLNRAFEQLRSGSGDEPVADIRLESGESASVILEHDCCSGAGFDAVAIRTSDGREFYAKKNYCGLEGFYASLHGNETKDLNHFKSFLLAQGYHKK